MTCGIIPPRYHDLIGERDGGYLPECILKANHQTPHIFKNPEGKFIAWEDDWSCDCCEPEEVDRCIVYQEIEEAQIPGFSFGRT